MSDQSPSQTNAVTVVIRSCGERTSEFCQHLVEQQVSSQHVHLIEIAPFSDALVRTFEIGLDAGRAWTAAVDADVLVHPHAISTLMKAAERIDPRVFEFQANIFDKLFQGPRSGGIHLYRTELLAKALPYAQRREVVHRPEFHVIQQMETRGYPQQLFDFVVGLHDFEQYLCDYYRKGFVHAQKHADLLTFLEPMWSRLAVTDIDFQFVLTGMRAGLAAGGVATTNKQHFDGMGNEIEHEKTPITAAEFDSLSVENELAQLEPAREFVEWSNQVSRHSGVPTIITRFEAESIAKVDVLFLGNDASRSGAPTSLLRLLRWFKEFSRYRVGAVLMKGGPLLEQYHEVAQTWVWKQSFSDDPVATELLPADACEVTTCLEIKRVVEVAQPALLIANTTAAFKILPELPGEIPALGIIRELDRAIEQSIGVDRLQIGVSRCKQFLAVSQAVREQLIERQGVPAEMIRVVPGCLPVKQIPDKNLQRQRLRELLDLHPEAKLIIGVGTIHFEKGVDLFVELCAKLNAKSQLPTIHCAWFGEAIPEHDYMSKTDRQVSSLGVESLIHFPGVSDDIANLMAGADLFALTSRSDSCPLVVMESALAGVPVACFAGAGGAVELIRQNAGIVAPYLDVEVLAAQIADALQDERKLANWAQNARDIVKERHDIAKVGPQFEASFAEYIGR